jgi:predicted DNA repair protein MutK
MEIILIIAGIILGIIVIYLLIRYVLPVLIIGLLIVGGGFLLYKIISGIYKKKKEHDRIEAAVRSSIDTWLLGNFCLKKGSQHTRGIAKLP